MFTSEVCESREINRVLVTGGSGYLGRNVIRSLIKQGKQVTAIARSQKSTKVVESLGARSFAASLEQASSLTAAAAGCDTIIHCAASVSQFGGLEESRRINVDGTLNVMNAAIAAGVQRVVHVGTEAACVNKNGDPLRNLDESTPLPDEPFPGVYTMTKNEAERVALSKNGAHLEVVVVRPRLIWGKDDTVMLEGFIDATKNGILRWFDGGEYLTSTCHVDNVVEGIELAATVGRPGQSYFLTDGAPHRFREFVSGMLTAAGVEPPTQTLPSKIIWGLATVSERVCSFIGCQPVIPRQTLVLLSQEITVNDAKARSEMGYQAKVTFEEGIQSLKEHVTDKSMPTETGTTSENDKPRQDL